MKPEDDIIDGNRFGNACFEHGDNIGIPKSIRYKEEDEINYYIYICENCKIRLTIYNKLCAPIGVYCPNCHIIISPHIKKFKEEKK